MAQIVLVHKEDVNPFSLRFSCMGNFFGAATLYHIIYNISCSGLVAEKDLYTISATGAKIRQNLVKKLRIFPKNLVQTFDFGEKRWYSIQAVSKRQIFCCAHRRIGLRREVTEKARTKAPRQIISADKCGSSTSATNRRLLRENTAKRRVFFS